jgi:YNFM family putative membrane transporter
MGSSISGTTGGIFYTNWGWDGVVLLILSLLGLAFSISLYLRTLNVKVQPLSKPVTT